MESTPIFNPIVPYIGPIPRGCQYGTIIHIDGHIPPHANRFAVNIQCGPNTSPRDDVAFHIGVDLNQNRIVRNSIVNMSWGHEEAQGYVPLGRGQPFSFIILCEPHAFKLAINGTHFTEMAHRVPLHRASFLAIDGDVTITRIQCSGGQPVPGMSMPGQPIGFSTQVPPYPTSQSHPTSYGSQNTPYPVQPGMTPMGYPGYPNNPPGYPSNSYGGHGHSSHGPGAGLLGVGATGLGAGLVGTALAHKLSPKKALKAHKKASKKALKYGLPIAGVGLGAYTVGKIIHRSSSSSSSSSSD